MFAFVCFFFFHHKRILSLCPDFVAPNSKEKRMVPVLPFIENADLELAIKKGISKKIKINNNNLTAVLRLTDFFFVCCCFVYVCVCVMLPS